jgi:hypothetical protein
VVTGSLQAKVEDRTHDRSGIAPVSVILDEGVVPVDYFRDQGELGVSSFVFWDADQVYVSTGSDLVLLHLAAGTATTIDVDDLVDVHEMTRVGDRLWLSNTGRDEVIAVDPGKGHQVERVPLGPFRPNHDPSSEAVDRFHTNQVFDGPDDQLYALVHHATGRQLLKRVKSRLLKSHGDGGVIDLVGRRSIDLALTAPHSVTRVGDGWWVCDSGKAEMALFSSQWDKQGTVPTSGWGRGASLTDDGSVLFVGLSPIRTRYRSTVSSPQVDQPAVEAIDTSSRRAVGLQIVPGIEQVNNVYLVPDDLAKRLLALDATT